MSLALAADGIHKTYRRGWRRALAEALKGVSLEVSVGETFGFIGPNGAGKSTLIKIFVGALRADRGRALIFDRDVSDPQARLGLGFVPENPSLPDFLTPYETVLMSLRLHRVKPTDERKHVMGWLERLELAAVADKPLRSFSKGMLQRTALAQALAPEPPLLILDEPLSGLDPIGRRDVVDILAEYRRKGGTLFFSSHVLHDVERLADRFGLINQGQLCAVRSPAELSGADDVVEIHSYGDVAVEGMSAEAGTRWICRVSRSELWAVLQRLREAGHSIHSVRPTMSLEGAFMAVVRGDRDVAQ